MINNNPYIRYYNTSNTLSLKVAMNSITKRRGKPAYAILSDDTIKIGGNERANYGAIMVIILLLLIYLIHKNPIIFGITTITLLYFILRKNC